MEDRLFLIIHYFIHKSQNYLSGARHIDKIVSSLDAKEIITFNLIMLL